MASLNKVMLIGNLTRDPELRVTPKGTAICQFGMAVNRQFKDEGGTMRDDTTFVDVEAWGKTGENIAKYMTKGRPLFIEGRLKLDTWEDKTTGQKRSKMKVVCEQCQFLGGRESGSEGRQPDAKEDIDQTDERHTPPPSRRTPTAETRARAMGDNQEDNSIDEDVPF